MADASAKQVLFEPIFSNNPIALQILDDLHPVKQLGATRLQLLDLLDARFEQDNFILKKFVAGILVIYLAGIKTITHEHQAPGENDDQAENSQKFFFSLFPELLAPGQ